MFEKEQVSFCLLTFVQASLGPSVWETEHQLHFPLPPPSL